MPCGDWFFVNSATSMTFLYSFYIVVGPSYVAVKKQLSLKRGTSFECSNTAGAFTFKINVYPYFLRHFASERHKGGSSFECPFSAGAYFYFVQKKGKMLTKVERERFLYNL